jgi:hypothetical protein
LPRRSWPLALVAGAGLAVPLLTRRAMHFPPSLAVGAALAFLVAVSLASRARLWRFLDPAVAAATGLASAAQHLLPGIVWGHDAKHHIWGAYAYLEAWREGDLLPVWLHHLGLGEPMPLFYGPIGFWAMAPAALVGAGARGMFATSFAAASVVAALAARHAVLAWTADRRAALLAGVAFALAPYRLCDVNYRSAVGESWALALLPLLLLAFHGLLTRGERRDFVRAAVATALVALAHPISLLMVAPLLPLLWGALALVGDLRPARATRAAAVAAGAALGGLLLAGFFTIPLVAEKRFLALEGSVPQPDAYWQEAARPAQLVDRQLWDSIRYSASLAEETATPDLDMPFYMGVVALVALYTAAFASSRASRSSRLARPLAAVGLVAAASAVLPVARWESAIPLLPTLQFPWRFLGPASCCAALAVGAIAARGRGSRALRPLAAAAAFALIADGFAFTGAVRRLGPWRDLSIYRLEDHDFGTASPVPRPWPRRVAGLYLPPLDREPPVDYVAEVSEGWIDYPYSEYFSSGVHHTADTLRWADLSVEQTGWGGAVTANLRAKPYARLRSDGSPGRRGLPFQRGAGRIVVRTPGSGGQLTVAEESFPGWQVRAGDRWLDVEPQADGLLHVRVAPGVRRVELRFDRWRADRLLGWIATALTAVLLALVARLPSVRRGATLRG